jgi:hypothetical protein
MQPVRTAFRGLEQIEDLEGGLGLVVGPPDLRLDRNESDRPKNAPEQKR